MRPPVNYFYDMFDEDLIRLIVENTNFYSQQKRGESINTNSKEITDFLGMIMLMSLVKMPSYRDYWSTNFRYEQIASIMPRNRFELLKENLHFVNNESANESNDRYFKVRPVVESVRKNCLKIEQEGTYSIDEQIIPYTGKKAGSRRQFVKNKPHNCGFKVLARAGVSGIIYDFFIYSGKNEVSVSVPNVGVGGQFVIDLCRSITDPACSFVFVDNFFTSFDLLKFLREEYGIFCTGTMRADRLKNCTFKSTEEMKKEGRGSVDMKVDNKNRIAAVKWYDNKPVHVASSYTGAHPITTIRRYSRQEKKYIEVPCPFIVKEYNENMGGVDLADMLIFLYRTIVKSKKWYMCIFTHLLDVAICNAWLLYRRDLQLMNVNEEPMPLKDFKYKIANSLILEKKRKRGRPTLAEQKEAQIPPKKICKPREARPENNVRFDEVDHFPVFAKKGRCKYCPTGQTTVVCEKCGVHLCLVNDRNCFYFFHKKPAVPN